MKIAAWDVACAADEKKCSSWLTTTALPLEIDHHDASPVATFVSLDQGSCCQEQMADCASTENIKSATIGSLLFLLNHVVYCLAQASTITRPHADHSSVGVMAKVAAIGTLFSGPVFIWELGVGVPAIYPASDLFLSPFLAQVAADVDASLFEYGLENDDRAFLATFGALIGLGMLFSAVLCILAARIKLANMGSFLPYCVLCGFFSTIGVLIWSLGFSVDTGMKIRELIHYDYQQEGNESSWMTVWGHALLHHAPSVAVGVTMYIVAERNSLYVIALIFATVLSSYSILWITGTSLDAAQDMNWFFSAKDLQDPPFFSSEDEESAWWWSWAAPAPMGVWVMMLHGDVHWPSFRAGLATMSALVFLYVIRCSLHAAALKKNLPNVTRAAAQQPPAHVISSSNTKTAKEPSLGEILENGYGYSQLLAALTGGIATAPALGSASTLFKVGLGQRLTAAVFLGILTYKTVRLLQLGCDGVGPQYGSILLVLVFYLTNFQLVQYIPKPAVSSLMVLAGIDMLKTWLVQSYIKTKAKLEWMVAPTIVVLAFTVGMLNAIFLGVAMSTFIFVADFYRAGTVKFVGNGLALRSTVERGVPETTWLNQNGDLIQILVLQNYLFFGNAQSVWQYASTFFEDPVPDGRRDGALLNMMGNLGNEMLQPKPKYVVIDFGIVTGLDTSAVDILREISSLCRSHGCRLFFSGLSPSLKSKIVYAGISPSRAFAPDLESALIKAEDALIREVSGLRAKDESESRAMDRVMSDPGQGFLQALKKIDEQHGLDTAHELKALSQYMKPMDLKANEVLHWENEIHHGLFFIEYGQLRIEHGADYTISPSHQKTFPRIHEASPVVNPLSNNSLGHLSARSGPWGLQSALLKNSMRGQSEMTEQNFRLARIGPGWVVGMIEECSGMRRAGVYVCDSPCRVHHLQYDSMKHIEQSDPKLMMNLYKLMSNVSLKRQELTIRQLAQFVAIIQSPSYPIEPETVRSLARVGQL
ncbi:solute carrier family 26 [Seminavis robusta]|uniref:Solute carrier family 26 n=1 Tax=Seminavis robusta TaxID=568900 RepID=A0A9N8E6G8_9STRA|nr:solute carrier family 26 [Seminavis robusta]|eukprot:Sro713_g191610.1 solute carrier family 26 (988) ;mRNA; f:33285-36429